MENVAEVVTTTNDVAGEVVTTVTSTVAGTIKNTPMLIVGLSIAGGVIAVGTVFGVYWFMKRRVAKKAAEVVTVDAAVTDLDTGAVAA
jgi:hypothetical protein